MFPSFVLDLANSHEGSLDNAIKIVEDHAAVVKRHGVRAAIKFQLRNLVNFEHGDAEYQKKFKASALDLNDYKVLAGLARDHGLMVGATPFDPFAVLACQGVDFIKIASCSAKDWETINEAASLRLPMIFSTGGLDWEEIDNLVSFAEHKGLEFALMHCVSIYPTPPAFFNLLRIDQMRRRYPGVQIGWSSHENPTTSSPSTQMAYAYGARIFERHIQNKHINDYSCDPDQTFNWIQDYQDAADMSYKTDWIGQRAALMRVERKDIPAAATPRPFKRYIHHIKAMLNEAKIIVGNEFDITFSAHYGESEFHNTGATFIEIVNRDYCKKLMILLPSQRHPDHYHKLKDETFHVLSGSFYITVNKMVRKVRTGEIVTVQPGVWHSFYSTGGAIIEEISTKALPGDTVYKDKCIEMNINRKLTVKNWGRFEL